MTLCDIVRHLPRSLESDDCRSKFNSLLHTENYNVSCRFSAICVEFSDTQSQPVATRQPVHSLIGPQNFYSQYDSRYVGCHWLIKPATLIGRNASLWLRSRHKYFVAYAVCARAKIFCLPFHWFVRAIINIVCDCYNE